MNIPGYKDAVSSSLYNIGNTLRLRRALEKKNINLAFAGGSVTKGWDGKQYLEKNYTDFVTDFLKDEYPDRNFRVSNLSTESANSFIGLSITDKVIKEADPDIVFIEYAVNNECGHDHIVSYESLVERMLSLPSAPAVVLVFLINKSLYTSQGYMKIIGSHYGLLSVSVADSLKKMLDDGFDWSVYSDDVIHPNTWGHRFIADCVINALKEAGNKTDDTEYVLPDAIYSLDYADYHTYGTDDSHVKKKGFEDISCPEYGEFFNNGVRYTGSNDASVRFEGEFRTLFAAYVHDKTDRFSDADIMIDGEKKGVLQGRSIYGWGNVVLKNVFSFETRGRHSVELKVRDKKKDFILIEFGVS